MCARCEERSESILLCRAVTHMRRWWRQRVVGVAAGRPHGEAVVANRACLPIHLHSNVLGRSLGAGGQCLLRLVPSSKSPVLPILRRPFLYPSPILRLPLPINIFYTSSAGRDKCWARRGAAEDTQGSASSIESVLSL